MTWRWGTSTRGATLPPNWRQLRAKVKNRAAGRCQATTRDGRRCARPGVECDHIGDRDDHSLANLQWLCAQHHRIKTLAQASAARAAARARGRHPGEVHPGLC